MAVMHLLSEMNFNPCYEENTYLCGKTKVHVQGWRLDKLADGFTGMGSKRTSHGHLEGNNWHMLIHLFIYLMNLNGPFGHYVRGLTKHTNNKKMTYS